MIHARLIVLAAALGAAATSPAPAQDWNETVAKACEHRRYAMRRAVSKKVAKAGDEAVPAIRAYAEAKGRNRVPLLLVDAIANEGTDDEAVIGLLSDWAGDRTFYWRSQALAGLARRKIEEMRPVYQQAVRDVSHLYRIAGAQGLHLLDPQRDAAVIDKLIASDPDPRVQLRLAAFLLDLGDKRAAGHLVAALALESDFVGDPWGQREADRALKSLRKATAQKELGLVAPGDQTADTFREALRGDGWHEPDFGEAKADYAGGVGIRSCRNGDLFLRWTETGVVFVGLLPRDGVQIDPAQWERLAPQLPVPDKNQVHGRVVCDYLEIVAGKAALRTKSAPSALPSAAGSWLGELASALATTDTPDLADDLRGRVRQFAGPEDQ